MANKKIYELEELTTPVSDDLLLINQSSTSKDKKVKMSNLVSNDTIESAVSNWLDDHPEATTTVEDGSITPAKLHQDTLDMFDEKADIDGYYEDMSVGSAEQLLSNTYESDSTPYLYRTSGGSIEIGNRVYEDAIVGGSVAWNQLVDTNTTEVPTISGRKYLTVINGTQTIINGDGTSISVTGGTDNVHDLTLMFGSSIADYMYSIEQATAGSGVAIFRSYYPKTNYAYNAGGIQSVKTSAKKVVGFNAYDNATGKAHLVGGHEYQITGAYTALAYSTGETITPDANGKFTPSADGELTVTGGNATTTCVHLVWDGERDGEYEPYVEHTYPLDSDLELRGVPTLVDGKIKYDGDTYASDGTVTRNIVELEITSCNSVATASSGAKYASINLTRYAVAESANNNFLSDKYQFTTTPPTDSGKWFRVTRELLIIFDERFTDKTTANGILATEKPHFIYKPLEPTTESADPYTNPQLVDNWGTEQFVDTRDVPVPVGHDSRYLPDLKAKLESAPNNPSTNGKYFLQYQNGEATYVPVLSEVPQTPSEDGTYVLKATVTSGTATLSWVAEE